jgi:hypothetical protein
MTRPPDKISMTGVECIVLARLSSVKSPSETELTEAVSAFAMTHESPAQARAAMEQALAALCRRGLALVHKRRRTLTESGARALQAEFSLPRLPTWPQIRDRHLPALALGLAPGSDQTGKALRDKDTVALAVLRDSFNLPEGTTITAVCDALLAEALAMPADKITLASLRAHVLARRLGAEPKGTASQLVARRAAVAVGAPGGVADKRELQRAVVRKWNRREAAAAAIGSRSLPPTAAAAPPASGATPTAAALASPSAPAVTLLTATRNAIPHVGADGRFGTEKVFVSAIWRRIEGDRCLPELSLDRFKRWLITANREGQLVLARADLVAMMDATLVADSEIEDQGATFHFVLDPQTSTTESGRRIHAR